MPLPKGRTAIQTLGLQKGQKKDGVGITKGGDIHIGGIVRENCGLDEKTQYWTGLDYDEKTDTLYLGFYTENNEDNDYLKLTGGKLTAKSKFNAMQSPFMNKFINPDSYCNAKEKETYIWTVTEEIENVETDKQKQETFFVVDGMASYRLEYDTTEENAKEQYCSIKLTEPSERVSISIRPKPKSEKGTKSYSEKKLVQ